VEKLPVGTRVFSKLTPQLGQGEVIDHPSPEIRPMGTVFVKFEKQDSPVNCSPHNLEKRATVVSLETTEVSSKEESSSISA